LIFSFHFCIQNIDSIVDLKIILPDREIVVIRTKKNATADSVYNSVIDKIQMAENIADYFYLFEIVEYNFGKYQYLLIQ
jgi:sorting nexin-27